MVTGVEVTPVPWFPLFSGDIAYGRLADTLDNQVRLGMRGNLSVRLRPLARLALLALEPSLSVAWLKSDGNLVYRESAAQWLAVWHVDARSTLRAIVQRGKLERRPGGLRDSNHVESLTYTWRQSAGTVVCLGASRSRTRGDDSLQGSEAFLKLQFDVDEMRARF